VEFQGCAEWSRCREWYLSSAGSQAGGVATGDLTRDRDGARDGMRATVAEAEGVRQWGLDASARDWFLWEATSKGSGAEMRWCRQEEGGAGLGAAAREEGEVGLGAVAAEEGGAGFGDGRRGPTERGDWDWDSVTGCRPVTR
jgi:hypothetical protein